jgi:hypothetical protein
MTKKVYINENEEFVVANDTVNEQEKQIVNTITNDVFIKKDLEKKEIEEI